MSRVLLRLLVRWETLLVVAIVGVGIWSTTLSPYFLTRVNLLDLATPYVFVGLLALGLTFVVVAGEIDISVASILAVSVVTFAQLFDHGVDVWVASAGGLVVATALGLVNGALVGLLNLPSLAVTLGTLAAFQGLAFVILSGEGVATFPQSYLNVGGGYIRNELPVALVLLLAAALVLGGVDIFGGAGSILGVLLALILVAVLRNGMQLANLGGDTQNIVIGVLLLAAITAGNLVRAAQAGAIAPGRLRLRRKEVVRSDDAPPAAIAPTLESQTRKGR